MSHDLRAGDLLDAKYRIDALLGEGGMGAVYRATHLGTTRTVAVKVIRPHLSDRAEFLERFRREAEAAGRLRHPNVVDVTDFGIADAGGRSVAYLVMEFLDGCTLSDVLAEERRLPVPWVVDVLEQVCSALDDAHAHGIVHRDLKPDNIWLEPNRRGGFTVKVLDFGLVKLGDAAELPAPTADPSPSTVDPDDSQTPTMWVSTTNEDARTAATTRPGGVTGTPLYMSPEQCRGDAVDGRSDIYSLGVVAYRMLTGETPFAGDARTLLRQHVAAAPRPLRELNRRVPARVAALVMAALAKHRDDRPSRAGAFAAALRAAAEGSGTLLRQALALYSERCPALLRVSLVGYIPLVVVLALIAPFDSGDGQQPTPPLLSLVVVGLMVLTNVAAYAAVSAAVVPLVMQSIVAPLQPPAVAAVWDTLRRRWAALAAATLLVGALVFAASLLLVLPGIVVAIAHVLYAPVMMMEDVSPWAALRRARELARRSWSTVLIITLLQFALPVLVWLSAVDLSLELKLDEQWQPQSFGFAMSLSWSSALYQLLNIAVAPLTATMTVLLYLKSRHAGGESLRAAAERIAADGIGRSRWQARMRGRSSAGPIETAERSAPSPAV